MDFLTRFAIKNSRVTILFIVFIFIGGIFAFLNIPSREDPAITIREAQVTAYYPGLSAQQMEDLVAIPLERAIKQIPEVEDIKTTVKTGYVLVQPKLYDRYFHLESIWQDLRNKMTDIKGKLPKETVGPFVNDDYGRVSEITIALTGDGFNLAELRESALDLQDRLGQLTSVSRVDIYGIQEETIFLDFNGARLAHYGITPESMAKAIRSQNTILPSGTIIAEGQRIAIQPTGEFKTLEEIRNLQIFVPEANKSVYLRDIMDVTRTYVDPPNNPVFYNHKPGVVLALSMMEGRNIKTFEDQVTTMVDHLQSELPLGMTMAYATYQPDLVKASIHNTVVNLYQAVAIVLLVVIYFLGLRTGMIVGTIVPLTILLTIISMFFMKIDLERMSIAAIIISLGLLVDNAIVIAEDMICRMEGGMAKKEAAFAAASSLGIPLLSSSLTTIFAFFPLMLADNVTGEFVRSLGQVIVISLLASWFLAIFAIPTLCFWFLGDAADYKKEGQETYEEGWYVKYAQYLRLFMNHKNLFLAVMAGGLGVSLLGFKLVVTQMMPPSDRNQFLIYLDTPAGSDVTDTIKSTNTLMEWLNDKQENPEITSFVAYVGAGGPRFFLSLSPVNPDTNTAFLVVNTQNPHQTSELVNRVNQFLAKFVPEVDGRAKLMWLGPTEIGMMDYRIKGHDFETLYRISDQLQSQLKAINGMVTVTNDWQNQVFRLLLSVDQVGARRVGVTTESLAHALNTYFDGYRITDYREGDKIIPVILRGERAVNNIDRLRTLPVLSQDGQAVPLLQIMNFAPSIVPEKIKRYDQVRTITVSAKHQTLQASELHQKMLPFIEKLDLPPGYSIEYGGEVEGAERANYALFKFMPHALALIMLILVFQFNSIRRMGMIMLTVPLVLIGAVWGLLLSGAFLSFNAILGIFSLAGIIVNNGIVLIDKIDSERQKNIPLEEAIVASCVARLRPIVMTTVTTILGLLPLALTGGDLWFGMAIVMIFGLLIGSILTLGVIPILYYLFFTLTLDSQWQTHLSFWKRKRVNL